MKIEKGKKVHNDLDSSRVKINGLGTIAEKKCLEVRDRFSMMAHINSEIEINGWWCLTKKEKGGWNRDKENSMMVEIYLGIQINDQCFEEGK